MTPANLDAMRNAMRPSEFRVWLKRQIELLQGDLDAFGPTPQDTARLRAMQRMLARLPEHSA